MIITLIVLSTVGFTVAHASGYHLTTFDNSDGKTKGQKKVENVSASEGKEYKGNLTSEEEEQIYSPTKTAMVNKMEREDGVPRCITSSRI